LHQFFTRCGKHLMDALTQYPKRQAWSYKYVRIFREEGAVDYNRNIKYIIF
jgi:hypothetical protein